MTASPIHIIAWALLATCLTSVRAETPSIGNLNVPLPTWGGKQVWGDELVFHGYRIQRQALTGHYRLLDAADTRRAWGRYDECVAALDEIKRRDKLEPMRGTVVLVLHGLGRSHDATAEMTDYLRDKGKLTAVSLSYPSTLADVTTHAESLGRVIAGLPEVNEIHFVAHSLGNLVIRRWLHLQLAPDAAGKPTKKLDARIGRIVMLGPPNNGARIAEIISRSESAIKLLGPPGRELSDQWDALAKNLAVPPGEFGIIAGGRGDDTGYNPLLPGDDDLLVTVAETRLPGAADFLCLPVLHTFLMESEIVQRVTLHFLQHGKFEMKAAETR